MSKKKKKRKYHGLKKKRNRIIIISKSVKQWCILRFMKHLLTFIKAAFYAYWKQNNQSYKSEKSFLYFFKPHLSVTINGYTTFNIKEFSNSVDYISRYTRQECYIFIGVVLMKFGMYMNIGWYNATKIIFSCYNTQAWSCEEWSKFEVIKKESIIQSKRG